jgi:hypothetical protein
MCRLCVLCRACVRFYLTRDLFFFLKDNLDDGDHPFHLHGHKFYMCVACSEY